MRKITYKQLRRAVRRFPRETEIAGKKFLQRGLSEYKRVALQTAPWRIGGYGGGIPRDTGNLREKHRTKISGLEGRFGVDRTEVRYAGYVHQGTRYMEERPWLDYARQKADAKIRKHFNTFADEILEILV